MRKTVWLGWLLVVGAAGCAVDDVEVDDGLEEVGGDEEDEGEFRYQCSGTPDPDWGCRTCGYQNSPIASGYPIEVLEQYPRYGSTAPNQMTQIQDDATPYPNRHDVKVVDGEIIAMTTAGDLTGHDLLGWSLVVKNGPSETLLLIDSFDYKEDWVECRPIPTYGILDWVPGPGPDGGSWESVCPGLSGDATTVVFTEGETYNANGNMEVLDAPEKVTVACRSHAVAKLKFAGYDVNHRSRERKSTPEQREAGLRMFSAAYCAGTGTPYTQTGTPIAFTDPLGFHKVSDLPIGAELEAKWTPTEAICLEEPRLFPQTPPCNPYPPRCTAIKGGLWESYNP